MKDERRSVDGKLREKAELFRFIVESAEDYAIFTTDVERRVTSWNTGAERLMGWTEAEFVDHLVSRLAEQLVLGPLGEGDLRHELWFNPVDGLAHRRLAVIEGLGLLA